jgi:hypothetical protein
MTNLEAIIVRNKFKSTKGYDELIKHWPKLDKALNKLPDESEMVFNVIIMEMYEDAKKLAKRIIQQ